MIDWGVVFAPRFHPKIEASALAGLKEIVGRVKARVVDCSKMNAHELTVSSDINIADWGSTSQYASALAGVPTVVTLFPDDTADRVAAGYPGRHSASPTRCCGVMC